MQPILRLSLCAVAIALAAVALGQTQTSNTLYIYVIDVEGGNATLLWSPSQESLLIDTGNSGDGAVRDAGRIMPAIRCAGLQQIDHLIITHCQGDHYGSIEDLRT